MYGWLCHLIVQKDECVARHIQSFKNRLLSGKLYYSDINQIGLIKMDVLTIEISLRNIIIIIKSLLWEKEKKCDPITLSPLHNPKTTNV